MNQNTTDQFSDDEISIDYLGIIKNRYLIILLVFLVVFVAGASFTHLTPSKYQSSAMIELKPIADIDVIGSRGSSLGPTMGGQFMNTQFAIILAPETLGIVVDRMQLETNWGTSKSGAIGRLRSLISTEQIRGTDLIRISVTHQDKEEAKKIAENVYQAYSHRRHQLEIGHRTAQLDALKIQLRETGDKVSEMRKRLMDKAEKIGVIYDEKGGQAIGGELGLRGVIENQIYSAERTRDNLEIQINKMLSIKEEDYPNLSVDLPDVGYNEVYDKLEIAKAELKSARASGLGKKHPEILLRELNIAQLKEQLSKKAESVRESLNYQLELMTDKVKHLKTVKADIQDKGSYRSRTFQEFEIARQNYTRIQDAQDTIQQKYEAEEAKLSMPLNSIIVHQYPEVGNTPVSPDWTKNLGIAAAAGLVLGLGLAFLLELMDTSVKTIDDVEKFLRLPVLAVIPQSISLLHKQHGMSPDAEAYRILRTNIEFNRKDPKSNAISLVSGAAGEGKSTTLVNLAYICAQGGYSTLIIDADLRRPRIHTMFDISNSVGLTNYLTTDLLIEDVVLQTPVDNLYFLPSGILPDDAAGILNTKRMSDLIKEVKSRFDLVLVDSPPILGVSDASVIANEVDHTMIVVQHRKLPRKMLLRAKSALENVGANILGVVLNNVDIKSDSQYQYYTSYYTYYAPTQQEQKVKPENKPSSSAFSDSATPTQTNNNELY